MFSFLVVLLFQNCKESKREQPVVESKNQLVSPASSPTLSETNNDSKPHKRNAVQDSLHDAITYVKDPALIRALVKRGADVSLKDENGFYPLYWAQYDYQYGNKKDSGVINTLLDLGAIDYNAQLSHIFELCESGNVDSVKLLIDTGLDVNTRRVWYDPPEEDASCYCYETLISASVRSHNLQLVQFLLDRGAEINFDHNGVQPLAVALQERQYAIADLLVQHDAIKENTFALGEPFYYYGPEDTVYIDYLVHTLFVYQTFEGVQSPLQRAASTGNITILKKIVAVTPKEERSSALCFSTTREGADLLLRNGAQVNSIYSYYGEGGCTEFRTPLGTAVETGELSYIKFLIENGADVNFLDSYMKEYADKEGYSGCNVKSPLTLAILNEKTDAVRLLIDRGANVNFIIQEHWNETFISPLIAAIQKNDIHTTKLLLTKGAEVKNRNVSAFDYVTESTSRVIVDALNTAK